MIKLVFSGKCAGCTLCDLIIKKKEYPSEYEAHCVHEEACARDPVNVVYEVLKEMNELFKSYEEKGKRDLADKEVLKVECDDLIDYLSQFDESDVVKVKYVRQKIEEAVGEKIDWYEKRR